MPSFVVYEKNEKKMIGCVRPSEGWNSGNLLQVWKRKCKSKKD